MSNEKVLKNQLLIESSEFSAKVKLSKALKESVKLSQGKAGTLIVRNVPCTILNRRNQNGRIYPTDVMEKAIKEARMAIETKQLLSKPNEHPDSSFVAPSEASHVIIDAYIKRNVNIVVEGKKERQDVLFMDWEVLNTQNGKDLRALLEAECSIGTSIRGVGDLVGDTVDNYQLLGVDIVGNPSSSTYTRMPVAESVKVEFADERALKEGFTVTSSSTDVAKDIESAGLLANKLDKADFATISNTSTKLEHDIDPKTGAQTTLVTFEADTSDDVTDLNQALAMAQRILTNPYSHVDSVTIENIDEEDETTGGSAKESVEEDYVSEEDLGMSDEPITEAAQEKDPKEGRKFVLKVPAGFVGMDGNALVFKENPSEALHFIVGKEESGLVHLSGVEKILDSMGVYDVEKYYRKPENEIKSEEPEQTEINGLDEVDDMDVDTGSVEESTGLTEGGNTKYSLTLKTVDESGLEDMKSLSISATDLQGALEEVKNHCAQQMASNDVKDIKEAILVDNETGDKYSYNKESGNFEPYSNMQESTLTEDDSVTQNGNELTVELGDGNGEVTKEFEDDAQASVAKAALEQGKVSGNIMLGEGEIESGWYVANEKIGICGPFETKEEAEDYFKDFADDVTIEYLTNDKSEEEETKITEDTKPQIQAGWYAEIKGQVFGPAKSEEEAKSKIAPKLLKIANIHYVSPEDVKEINESTLEEGWGGAILGGLAGTALGHPILGAAAGSLLQDKWTNLKKGGWKAGAILGGAAGSLVGMPWIGAGAGAVLQNMWGDKKESVEESNEGDIESGWYAGADKIGVVGPFESREEAEDYFKDFLDRVSIEYLSTNEEDEEGEDTLDEKLFDEPSDASDDFVEEPMEEGIFTGMDRLKDMGRSAKKSFNSYMNSDYTANNIFNAVEKDGLNYLKRAVSRNVDFSKMKDASGRTPLIAAIDGNKEDIVELFANDKRLINSPDNAGYTPIMHAIKQQNPNTINTILSHGANLGPNSKGISPVDYAQQFNDQTALSTLLDYFDANGKNPFEQQNQRTMNQNRVNAFKNNYNTQSNNTQNTAGVGTNDMQNVYNRSSGSLNNTSAINSNPTQSTRTVNNKTNTSSNTSGYTTTSSDYTIDNYQQRIDYVKEILNERLKIIEYLLKNSISLNRDELLALINPQDTEVSNLVDVDQGVESLVTQASEPTANSQPKATKTAKTAAKK